MCTGFPCTRRGEARQRQVGKIIQCRAKPFATNTNPNAKACVAARICLCFCLGLVALGCPQLAKPRSYLLALCKSHKEMLALLLLCQCYPSSNDILPTPSKGVAIFWV